MVGERLKVWRWVGGLGSCEDGMMGDCFFHAGDGIREVERSRGLGDMYKRQLPSCVKRGGGVLEVQHRGARTGTATGTRTAAPVGNGTTPGSGDDRFLHLAVHQLERRVHDEAGFVGAVAPGVQLKACIVLAEEHHRGVVEFDDQVFVFEVEAGMPRRLLLHAGARFLLGDFGILGFAIIRFWMKRAGVTG